MPAIICSTVLYGTLVYCTLVTMISVVVNSSYVTNSCMWLLQDIAHIYTHILYMYTHINTYYTCNGFPQWESSRQLHTARTQQCPCPQELGRRKLKSAGSNKHSLPIWVHARNCLKINLVWDQQYSLYQSIKPGDSVTGQSWWITSSREPAPWPRRPFDQP